MQGGPDAWSSLSCRCHRASARPSPSPALLLRGGGACWLGPRRCECDTDARRRRAATRHATHRISGADDTGMHLLHACHAHKAWILLLASVTPPHVAARARFWLMPPLINQSCHVCTNLGLARSHATLPDRNASCLCPRGLLALSHETATSGSGVICRRSAVRLRCASLPQLRSIGTVLRIVSVRSADYASSSPISGCGSGDRQGLRRGLASASDTSSDKHDVARPVTSTLVRRGTQ